VLFRLVVGDEKKQGAMEGELIDGRRKMLLWKEQQGNFKQMGALKKTESVT
jgi:hypothetical protein